jgi:hypothetical protein
VCVCFLSRVLFFSFWLGLPWPSWRVDLVTTAATAAPKAAAVSTRFLDNQHACSIVSSSSRLRPSLLFSSLLFHLALALTVFLSLSCAPSFARARARASSAWETLRRVARRGAGFCGFWRILAMWRQKEKPMRILQRANSANK